MTPRIAILAATLLAAGCTDTEVDQTAADESSPPALTIIAHRGFSARAPEHTVPAWDLAREAGADYLEQDLQMTSDGVLVVLHDATLDRTARGPAGDCAGAVIEKSLAQLRRCEVGTWFNAERPDRANDAYAGAAIPTLEEVFQRYGTSVRYYIETKNPEEAPGMEAELVRLIRAHGLLDASDPLPRVLVQSFSPESLIRMRELEPAIPLVQLFGRAPAEEVRDSIPAVSQYAAGIGPHFSSVDGDLIVAARAAGLVVHPYTVNDPAEMHRLATIGADGFFTDDPELARATLTPDS